MAPKRQRTASPGQSPHAEHAPPPSDDDDDSTQAFAHLVDDPMSSSQMSVTDNPTPRPHDTVKRNRSSNANAALDCGGGSGGGPSEAVPLAKDKSIHDRVHGTVALPPLLVAVMDTPHFQRLDQIQQLGGCHFVYPSAKHSRKEHSIGVAHLAGTLLKHLRVQQPELQISDDDVLCVQLAGLVHDLGHGPFSHMYETFVKWQGGQEELRAAELPLGEEREAAAARAARLQRWEHEEMSALLFDDLLDSNRIELSAYYSSAACPAEQRRFVKALIKGLKPAEEWPQDIGRDKSKRFLFDIVSNSRNGVDVDKLDYLLRDAMACHGASRPFELSRLFESTRVITPHSDRIRGARWTQDGRLEGGRRDRPARASADAVQAQAQAQAQICFQLKVATDLVEIYTLRAKLHKKLYQHHTANVAELMITDVLKLANDHFSFRGSDNAATTLAQAALDPKAFARLTDAILNSIYVSLEEGLDKAQGLIERMKKRDYYRQIGRSMQISPLPQCNHCGELTEIRSKFCGACGKKCRGRLHVSERPDEPRGPNNPAVAQLIGKRPPEFEQDILTFVDEAWRGEVGTCSDVDWCVWLVDIKPPSCSKCSVLGGDNLYWRVYDPLWNTGFYNPKEEGEQRDSVHYVDMESQMSPVQLPRANQERTLYLYLKNERTLRAGGSEARLLSELLFDAYEAWAKRLRGKGATSQEGNQNTPTHTPSRAQRRPAQGKSTLRPMKMFTPVGEGEESTEAHPSSEPGGD